MKRLLFIIVLLATAVSHALAHEVRPAYLELRQSGPETYDVLWKVPGQGEDLRLGLYVELPGGCSKSVEPRASMANGAFTERWSVKCIGELTGGTIHIAGLAETLTDVLVRLERLDGTTQVTRLTPSVPSTVVEAVPSVFAVARTYFVLGVEHILLGVDHLLFVLALLILVKGTRRLVVTVTAFTLAHSLTLAGATLGYVRAPGPPIEAVIALSIVFIAAEIVRARQGEAGLTQRFPWLVAFAFGLLHGFGFAGALSEVGLPQSAIPAALLCFNLGVEFGQLLFIAFAVAFVALARGGLRRIGVLPPVWAWRIPPYAIGGVAAFWVIQRVVPIAAAYGQS
jgi:hydrogenase/urease accessory protein HupE